MRTNNNFQPNLNRQWEIPKDEGKHGRSSDPLLEFLAGGFMITVILGGLMLALSAIFG